jgi:hypothetical protein
MSNTSGQVLSATVIRNAFVDKHGMLTDAARRWLQYTGQTINIAFNQQGQLSSTIEVAGLPEGLSGTLIALNEKTANLDLTGIMLSPGIDFSRIYTNQNINFIADGTGSPIAGGKLAFAALSASGPVAGQILEFNGTTWEPVTPAASVSQIIAGTGITVTPSGGTGVVTVAATSTATAYLKGTVVINAGGAASGTFAGSGTVTGAAVGMAAIGSNNGGYLGIAANIQNLLVGVTAANTVGAQITLPVVSGISWGSFTIDVVVFP